MLEAQHRLSDGSLVGGTELKPAVAAIVHDGLDGHAVSSYDIQILGRASYVVCSCDGLLKKRVLGSNCDDIFDLQRRRLTYGSAPQ